MDQEEMKKKAGVFAADLIKNNMSIGIGTGSTVYYFIERLIERVRDGLQIKAAFTSDKSEKQAEAGGIFSLSNEEIKRLDITVDGADEITKSHYMIKGGGGALLREKIIASSSDKMIVIVDESKIVKQLGKHKLPVEIISIAFNSTIDRINKLGLYGNIRMGEDNTPFKTDCKNLIYDIQLEELIKDVKQLHSKIIQIAGVVETGLFFDLPSKILVATKTGKTILEN